MRFCPECKGLLGDDDERCFNPECGAGHCSHCGADMQGLDGCSTPGCEGNPETDLDEDEEIKDDE